MDVLVTGYPSIDHIARVSHSPAVGETARLESVPNRATFGGCGINVAVALQRMGFSAGAAVVLGDDDSGRAYRDHLAALGIDTANVVTLPGELTSRSYLYLNPDGQYQNYFLPGAADAWSDTLVLHNAAQYHYALVTVGQLAYNRQFVARTRAAGVPLVWMMKADVYAYPPVTLREFLDSSAIVIMNDIEAEYVMRALGFTALGDLLGEKQRTIVVTRGAHGADVITQGGSAAVPAVPMTAVVDPTGAGDGFAAGLLAGLLRGARPVASAQLGAVVASFVLEAVGCQANLPDWDMALARYREFFGEFKGSA